MKKRLDQLVVLKGLAQDLKEAQALIMAGVIIVDDHRIDKAGTLCSTTSSIRKKGCKQYVSRGGLKLAAGIKHYRIDVSGLVCADIGASSGGFTDCLLQHDAKKVYAIDVAYGQLDWKIRQDPRVVSIERFNVRKLSLTTLDEYVDLVVADVSFISLTTILPSLFQVFEKYEKTSFLVLIKPQFELPKNCVGKNGVVEDEKLRQQAINKIKSFCLEHQLLMNEPVASPILGPKGNVEYLTHIVWQG